MKLDQLDPDQVPYGFRSMGGRQSGNKMSMPPLYRGNRRSTQDSVDEAVSYAFYSKGGSHAEEPPDAVKRRAMEELYQHVTGRKPGDLDHRELEDEILAHYREQNGGKPVRLKIIVMRIDPNDKTRSHLDGMKTIGAFLPESRKRFLDDTISHLGEINETRSDDRRELIGTLLKARRDGYMDASHEEALAEVAEKIPWLKDKLNYGNKRDNTTQEKKAYDSGYESETKGDSGKDARAELAKADRSRERGRDAALDGW